MAEISKATIDDADLLVKVRIDFLVEEGRIAERQEIETLKLKLRDFYVRSIVSGSFAAFIAKEGDLAVASAFLSLAERPPRKAFASNLVGTVYNVYTYPEFRKRGLATMLMAAVVEEARRLNVAYVDLLATAAGKPLYEKAGFEEITKYTAMRMDF